MSEQKPKTKLPEGVEWQQGKPKQKVSEHKGHYQNMPIKSGSYQAQTVIKGGSQRELAPDPRTKFTPPNHPDKCLEEAGNYLNCTKNNSKTACQQFAEELERCKDRYE